MKPKTYTVELPECTEEEYQLRGALIERIEALAGSLQSVPWCAVSTEDMIKLREVLELAYK